uniref:Uncharacterized protein n=1 Tax=Lepeophtheirus salmonis TaxID=72036 RepID=A0A0K2U9V4_LEPSM
MMSFMPQNLVLLSFFLLAILLYN